MHLPSGADILLWPGEDPPGDASVAAQADPPGDAPVVAQAAQPAVLEQLDNEARQALIQIIAAVEDRAREQGGQATPGSLVMHMRHSLPLNGGPSLSTSQVNRLLKTELVELRRVTEEVTEVRHPETGERREIHTYTLRRDHPHVAEALAAGQVVLSPTIELRLLTLADSPSTVPVGDCPEPAQGEDGEPGEAASD